MRSFAEPAAGGKTVFAKAAEFANHIEPERLISISHSQDEVVAVWYWSDDVEQQG
jgi:hypothetical protein